MKKWFLIAIFLISSVTWAEGHSVGNGGGVICIAGKCKTLIEAGLELNPEFDGVWLPTSEHIGSVQTAINLLALDTPLRKQLELRILGRLDHFRRAEIVDPSKLDAIKKQYIDMAAKAGFAIDPATFELVAFSSDDTIKPALTYILPKFFDLSTAQQMEFLIHEGLYRGQPTNNLRYVLQFENAARSTALNSLDKKLNLQIAGYHLGILNKRQLLGHLLLTVANDRGGTGLPGIHFGLEKYGEMSASDLSSPIFTFDLNRILDAGRIDHRIPYIFSKLNTLSFERVSRDSRLASCYTGAEFHLDDEGALGFCSKNPNYNGPLQYRLNPKVDFELILPN